MLYFMCCKIAFRFSCKAISTLSKYPSEICSENQCPLVTRGTTLQETTAMQVTEAVL